MKNYSAKLDKAHEIKVAENENGSCEVSFYEDGRQLGQAEKYIDLKTVEWDYGVELR